VRFLTPADTNEEDTPQISQQNSKKIQVGRGEHLDRKIDGLKPLSERKTPEVFTRSPLDEKIEAVYSALDAGDYDLKKLGLKLDIKQIFPKPMIIEIYSIANDINTTACMAMCLRERNCAEGMLEELDVKSMVEEIGIHQAKIELDEFYNTAVAYSEHIGNLLNTGEIENNREVRDFLTEQLTATIAAYARLRLQIHHSK
jgi:hypothetical protein